MVDSSYEVDQAALFEAIRERDHLIFRFSTIQLRLFVDFRSSEEDGPAVFVLPPAASVRERMASIRDVRPRLPRPQRLNVVAWPLRVGSLMRLGIVDEIRTRLGDMEGFVALAALDEAVGVLERAESQEVRRAIRGEGYRTLWAASAL